MRSYIKDAKVRLSISKEEPSVHYFIFQCSHLLVLLDLIGTIQKLPLTLILQIKENIMKINFTFKKLYCINRYFIFF